MQEPEETLPLTLFRRYYDELVGFLTAKLGCREQAADVAQDAYVRLLSMKEPHTIEQPRAFLYKTALNLTVDLFRRQRLRSATSVDLDTVEQCPSEVPDQEAVVDSKERLKRLQDAIEELPPKCRHVFLLHKFMGLPHAEIAARLGISKNMVEKHVIKAMAHCRSRMDETEGKGQRAKRENGTTGTRRTAAGIRHASHHAG